MPEQIPKEQKTQAPETEQTPIQPKDLSDKKEDLKEEMDALIDEIDEVLEENAEEFVKNYVQRGGQ